MSSSTSSSSSSSSSSVTYSSTRGEQLHLDFRSVVMQGLASDKGLFVPDSIPSVTPEELKAWQSLSFVDLAIQVIRKFVQEDQIPLERLTTIVTTSCAAFRTPEVTPVVQVGGHAILELFHGPTFAFKDVALQMLGNIFEYFLETGSNDGRLAVLGATSGDTGSAAIYGLRNKRGMDCIILFPHNRVSPLQERQMTTVLDSNIHCVAIENGTFDDCQDIVKASFGTTEFRDKVHLGAVNSINWCRVLAQTTYYFWSYFRVQEQCLELQQQQQQQPVSYSVPTGNFGDVLAGYYAKQMGLPVDKLIVATNENDILHRFFTKGEYHREDIQDSISPSMDICVSSNFERYLFHLAQNSPAQLQTWMNEFESSHRLTLTEAWLLQAQRNFLSARADTAATLAVIRDYYTQYNYLLCPHSAVGVSAIHQLGMVQPYTVCLATAHAGKFPDAVAKALDPLPLPPPPPQLAALESMPTRCARCPKDATVVQAFMEKRIQERIEADEKKMQETTTTTTLDQPAWQRWAWTAAVIGTAAFVIQTMLNKRRK